MTTWYIESGPEADVVISSRVRLARNFENYPFPSRMNSGQELKVLEITKDAVLNCEGGKKFTFFALKTMPQIDKQALVEKHVISRELAESKRESGVIISNDEKVSIMINEEDHLRIQSLYPGMQIDNAYKLCDKIDDILESKIDYAFSQNYGYLTCCPTNLGTGIRASVMMHLPALTMTGYIRNVLEACGKLGITVRGLYGENSEASGNMFQISNQVTMGLTEDEIIANVTNIASQIVEQERNLRNRLYKSDPIRIEDKVYRSLGLFTSARIISSEESLRLLSDIRLGKDLGIINNISTEILNEIMLLIQPANLQKAAGRILNPDERDVKRAEIIRRKLGYS